VAGTLSPGAEKVLPARAPESIGWLVGSFDKPIGTAFCVDPAGLFVTTARVVEANPGVRLVLPTRVGRPSRPHTRVLRVDADANLAVLKVERTTTPTLDLGDDTPLPAGQKVTAVGFAGVARNDAECPAPTETACRITAVRKRERTVQVIELDAPLELSYAGGPLLDSEGRVLGILAADTGETSLHSAVPVGRLQAMLAVPQLAFTPPALSLAQMHARQRFQAHAMSLQSKKPLALELRLTANDGPERRFPLERHPADFFDVFAPPVPPEIAIGPIKATVRGEDGSITGFVEDRELTIGKAKVRLCGVRSLHFQREPHAILHGGEKVSGVISGLEGMALRLGKADVLFGWSAATEATFELPQSLPTVRYSLIATSEGQAVGRLSGLLPIAGLPRDGGQHPASGTDIVEFPLPAPVADVVVAGRGRWLILSLPERRELAVFDTPAAKIVASIPTVENYVVFAAGLEKLVVCLPDAEVLQRWDLTTAQREAVAPLPIAGRLQSLTLGSGSRGPLLAYWHGIGGTQPGQWGLLDLATLQVADLSVQPARAACGLIAEVRAATDGNVFAIAMGAAWETLVFERGAATLHRATGQGPAIPGPDGKYVYAARGIFTREATPLGQGPEGEFFLPACHGDYYLVAQFARFRTPDQSVLSPCSVFAAGTKDRLATVPALDYRAIVRAAGASRLPVDKRIHFIPGVNLVVTIPEGNSRLILHRLPLPKRPRPRAEN
jgi:hypothetical protein